MGTGNAPFLIRLAISAKLMPVICLASRLRNQALFVIWHHGYPSWSIARCDYVHDGRGVSLADDAAFLQLAS
jgi:hypothetical protein